VKLGKNIPDKCEDITFQTRGWIKKSKQESQNIPVQAKQTGFSNIPYRQMARTK
jgi:hypothetical protein